MLAFRPAVLRFVPGNSALTEGKQFCNQGTTGDGFLAPGASSSLPGQGELPMAGHTAG